MGKGGDIWDDSALIRAYDDAVFKYKRMHGMGDGDLAPMADDEDEDDETTNGGEKLQDDDDDDGNAEHSEAIENPSSSSMKCVVAASEFESTTTHEELRPEENKDESAPPYPSGRDEYSQLLESYYNIEYQRQSILEQLDRYSHRNDQNPAAASSSTSYSLQCDCLYGCQNWILPCNIASATDNIHTAISRDAHRNAMPHGSSSDAARKAMSWLKPGNAANEGGKDSNGVGPFIEDKVSENSVAGSTDLAVVLNAWYNAGFHTGKYLSELSFEEKKKKNEHG
ncbi:hypothetical protein M569_03745 [Genlisea aurea]|uniref:Survival Motor Neuron Gemin2-binding domain-containing protein n=1 Tax=Genlisea aurea TaxID=192259 RepID=S8D111_9LAMI|nr:hypothetical protein M569_03745 [Genlisea aurea]